MAGYHFTAWELGQIKAHLHHGLGPAAIARILVKPDGKTHWSDNAVSGVIAKLKAAPQWRGERKEGSGAERQTTKAQDRMIVREVFRSRDRKKVTVDYLRLQSHG